MGGAVLAGSALGAPAHGRGLGFKLMMTPKWTGFPYFEAAAKGGKAAADELGDSFVYSRRRHHSDGLLQVETPGELP